jgi:hypothetical protein
VRANYRPSRKFSVSVSETWDRFRLPVANGNFSVVLASLQGNYSFSRFLTFTSVIQMDTSNTQAVSANLRLRYNYRQFDLYVIYNVGTQFASIAPRPSTSPRDSFRSEIYIFLRSIDAPWGPLFHFRGRDSRMLASRAGYSKAAMSTAR